MILVIDNYDSFVYNLVQILGTTYTDVKVIRNDELTVDHVVGLKPAALVISPGPGVPENAGITCDLISHFAANRIPILGVCLGHQAIGEVFGAKVVRSGTVVHGKVSVIYHDNDCLFSGVENPFIAARYHSLIVDRESVPNCFKITAWTEDGLVMGLRHKTYKVYGIQFHPESFLTPIGKKLLANFLESFMTVE